MADPPYLGRGSFESLSNELIWWQVERLRRDPAKLEQVYHAVERSEFQKATAIAGSSNDSVLRVLWFGLSHQDQSLLGAFQAAAGIEAGARRALRSWCSTPSSRSRRSSPPRHRHRPDEGFLQDRPAALTEEAIGGGIAEALIATPRPASPSP